MTTNRTNRVSLGRSTAAKTFTRNNNRRFTARKIRQASTQGVTTQQSCVAYSKRPQFLALTLGLLAAIFVFFSLAGYAQAETTGPIWKILAVGNPTNFKPNDQSGADAIVITAINVGGASTGCTAEQIAIETETLKPRPAFSPFALCPGGSPVVSPVTVSDSLPAGLKAVEVIGNNAYHDPFGNVAEPKISEASGPPLGLSCSLAPLPSCTTSEPVAPGDTLVVTVRVHVETSVEGSGEVNEASVSGGGAVGASASNPVSISSTPAEYGVAKGGLLAATSTSQAGAHPNVTTTFFLNTVNPKGESSGEHCESAAGPKLPSECALSSEPSGQPKDVRFDLPPGLLGTTVGMPTCTMAEVTNSSNCPRDTMVGTSTLIIGPTGAGPRVIFTVPVYNIAPAPGEPLALAFDALFFPVRIDASVLSDGEYNARVTVPDITGGAAFYMSSVTIWGDPAEHNGPGPDAGTKNLSGYSAATGNPQITFGGPGVEQLATTGGGAKNEVVAEKRVPLLSNPTQCSTPLTTKLETDSWEAAGDFGGERTATTSSGTATGCGELSFQAGVSMLPDTLEAGAPAGYAFDLSLLQNTEPEGLATPHVKRTSVTLPLGTVISPSAADGLGDCSSVQFFGPAAERHQERAATPGDCPRNSQVGTVRSKSPDLEEELTGEIYLASPECTGPAGVCTPQDAADGHMVRLFLQLVGSGEDGVVVKQELTGQINQQTGQLTVTDDEVPQVPFSDLKLTLAGGERATLANPRMCGTKRTTADLTPWSSPFTPDATPESSFEIEPASCFGPQFNPSFSAGTTSNDAGGYSPFTVSFGRGDASQFLNGLQVQMPPGLSGMIANVALCQEPQAAQGTCSPASQIGEVSVETGPGADPFLVTGGKVYLTGPYKGAPYGLSVVVPAKAGPYTLAGTTGNGTVVNRSSIAVNPETAVLTVTADPLPTELDGIPLQLRLVNVTVGTGDNFTFNPTSCNKMEVQGALTSTEAAKATDASSFQVTNCAALKFQPKFSASTSGKTSKANGASLSLKVTRPSGPGTGQANFRLAKIELPKQLPSRLTTLQKACTAAVFNANPTRPLGRPGVFCLPWW
jgi:hypothetical protein